MRFEVETNLYNPSALAKKFSSIQTNFDVTLGKISAIISDSDIEQYQDGHTTMNSRLSSAIQDLDGFHQQVSKMQITYDGQFESVDNRLTTFDTTLNGITADVSSVSREAIKTDTIHYLATSASDGVTTSTYGWTTTPQSVTSTKRYLWIYHTYTKGDNSTTDSDPVIAGVWGNTGNKGDKGDSGVSISGVTNYYLATSSSSGVTKSTSGWTTNIQTMTATNQYLWNYERITGSDGSTLSESEPVIIGRYGQNGTNGTNGTNGKGISSITEYYAVNNSTTAPSDSSFSTTVVAPTSSNKYLWNYEIITYTDSTTTSTSKRIIGTYGEKGDTGSKGDKGDKGDTGVSITSVTNYYLATSASSGVTPSTAGWTTSIQTMTSTKQYLWNYEVIKGSDNSTISTTTPVIIGRYGQNGGNGRGISSITEYYAVSSSNTTAPTSWYTSLVNTTITNKYLWNYERIAYTDGTTADTTKRVIGTHGETGDDGVGITATTPLRYASSSSTTPSKPASKVTSTSTAVGVWTTAIPALNNTYKYMFTCDQIEWDNGTITWSTVVQDNALTDLVTRVASAELKITEDAIVSTVRSSDSYKGDLASKNATFTGSYVPKSNNAPASTWTTTALKESHLNDTFITSGGELYQYISGHYGLMITFSSDSKTESVTYDYVRIYYKIGDTTYVLPDIGGTDISGASVFVPSNEFWLYWRSDTSNTYYGFRIASIDWVFSNTPTLTEATLPGIDPTPMSGTNYPETTHPYTNNEEKFWKYTNTSHSASVNPSYGWAKREDSGIRTLTERMSAAELKITDSAIVSTVTSSSSWNTLSSTVTQTATAVTSKITSADAESLIEQKADSIRLKADKISWSSTYSSMTDAGQLTCTGGKIGGFTIGSSAIYNGISSVSATSGTGVYLGTDGINLGGGKFKVTSSGAFQWTMTNSSMSNTGVLKCSNAEISGKITSTSGTIGGWTISDSSISRTVGRGTITLGGNGVTSTWGGYTVNFCGAGIWKGSYNYLINFANSYTTVAGDSGLMFANNGAATYVRMDTTSSSSIRFRPDPVSGDNGKYILGTSSDAKYRWYRLYCTVAPDVLSDLKGKNVISDYKWNIDEFIERLQPIAFTRKDGADNHIHYGFGAQDVYALVQDLNLGNLALYNANINNEDGEEREYHGEDIDDENLAWSLTYEQFIAPIVLEIQRLMKRVDALENGKGATI